MKRRFEVNGAAPRRDRAGPSCLALIGDAVSIVIRAGGAGDIALVDHRVTIAIIDVANCIGIRFDSRIEVSEIYYIHITIAVKTAIITP